MPALATLHDLMVHQIKDLYSAERQLVQALPKMARNATSAGLQSAIHTHLDQTREHVSRLEQCLNILEESTRGPKCKGMEGLLEEGKELLEEDVDPEVLDAGLIAAAQRVEHYEIAGYGTVCEYARIMGHEEVLELLKQTLEEEKATDVLLTSLAEGGINALAERDNQSGMGGSVDEGDADAGESEDGEDVVTATPRRTVAKATSKMSGQANGNHGAKSGGRRR